MWRGARQLERGHPPGWLAFALPAPRHRTPTAHRAPAPAPATRVLRLVGVRRALCVLAVSGGASLLWAAAAHADERGSGAVPPTGGVRGAAAVVSPDLA